MNRSLLGALSTSVALLVGCSGSQPPIGGLGEMTQAPSALRHAAQHGTSGSGDLMYVASNGKSYIISYPEGKLIGTINEGASDACSDNAGNAYLTTSNGVDEFSHGATAPSATFAVDGASVGCAIDPVTGNLAVTYYSESGAFLAVFSGGNGQPKVYSAANLLEFCGYDDQGNLFADYGTANGMGLVELPNGGNHLSVVSVSPSITQPPGRIQWDGKYLAIESGSGRKRAKGLITVKRVTVSGSSAIVVGTTTFAGIKRQALVSWIFNGSIILPFGNIGESSPNLGYWKYPGGGKPMTSIKHPAGKGLDLEAVTVSRGS